MSGYVAHEQREELREWLWAAYIAGGQVPAMVPAELALILLGGATEEAVDRAWTALHHACRVDRA